MKRRKEKWRTYTPIQAGCNPDGSEIQTVRFRNLSELPFVRHAFSTRVGGVSSGIFRSMNLGFDRGDDPEHVMENHRRLLRVIRAVPDQAVHTVQEHGTNVRLVTEKDKGKGLTREKDYRNTDALITDVPGVALAVFAADCVPLFFADPVKKAIGTAHSGWRGTVGRIGEKTVRAMRERFGSRPEDLLCAVGPSICPDCYEVSEDVAKIFMAEFPGHRAELLTPVEPAGSSACATGENIPDQKYLLDLQAANRIILVEAGVLPGHIEVTDLCTCCNPELFFSHRATHGKRGNNCGYLMLDEEEEEE